MIVGCEKQARCLNLSCSELGCSVWREAESRHSIERTEEDIVCPSHTGAKGQKRVIDFNLITGEGAAEPVKPFFIVLTETKRM